MANNEWQKAEWDDLKKGDLVRFESGNVALEGKLFLGSDGKRLRVELYAFSPSLGFVKASGFTPYKPFVYETTPISEENKAAFYKLLGVEYP